MPITGIHTLFHTSEPEALRTLLTEAFGLESVDVGGGWLIFGLPPAEMAVHPGESARHEITFMCDDLAETMAELAEMGVHFREEPKDEGWGIVVTMVLPGDVAALLYEPRHPTMI